MVTYPAAVDEVFKALADPTRRSLLDELHREDGQTLHQLGARFDMTRFGVMKHLKQLEEAGLVVSRRQGREKLHFLNPVPIRLVHDRWGASTPNPGPPGSATSSRNWSARWSPRRWSARRWKRCSRSTLRPRPSGSGTRSPIPRPAPGTTSAPARA